MPPGTPEGALDAPGGLAEVQAGLPALEQALTDYRIGDTGETEPAPLEELETLVTGPLMAARARADDAERCRCCQG